MPGENCANSPCCVSLLQVVRQLSDHNNILYLLGLLHESAKHFYVRLLQTDLFSFGNETLHTVIHIYKTVMIAICCAPCKYIGTGYDTYTDHPT